jgi:hypothetical protein
LNCSGHNLNPGAENTHGLEPLELEESEMKELETIKIVEDDEHKIGLENWALWQVNYTSPFQATLYVLAESEKRAIWQAASLLALESYSDRGKRFEVRATATRLPLYLQGWGSTQF